jgi:hypothetical protein
MRGILLACLFSAAPCGAAEPILGFNYPSWSADGYGAPRSASSFAEMREMGAGWVAIVPTLYVMDRADSEVLAKGRTATDLSVRTAIRAAHRLGLKVLLKPHVDMPDASPRAWLNPADPARWFATYGAHIERYARLAKEERCEMFSVGTELSLLTQPRHTASWRALIARTRALYPGPLTYAANWHSVALPRFWKDLDFIGVDAYFPLPGGTSRAALDASWKPWVLALAVLSKAEGKPVLFTEIGLTAQTGANLTPWAWDEKGELDLETQAAYMDSFVANLGPQPWFRGFLYWAWEPNAARTGPKDKSMSVQGKPAEEVLRRAFLSGRTPPPEGSWREKLEAIALRLADIRPF